MAGPDPQLGDPTDWTGIGEALAEGLFKRISTSGLQKTIISSATEAKGASLALAWAVIEEVALKLGEGMHKLETPMLPVIAAFVAPIIAGLFGAEVNEDDFARKLTGGSGTAAAQAIVDGFLQAIAGSAAAGGIEPGIEGATRIATAAVQASLEGTFNAMVPEIISDIFPEIGHFTAITELPEGIIRTLGVSRLVRRALSPLVDAACATPAKWHYGKLYQQTLLGASSLARQIARHPDQRDTWIEDLRRQGYSDARIDALLNEQAKFRSVSDVFRLVRAGQWSDSTGQRHLRDQGYDDDGAGDELLLEKLKAIETFEREMATSAVAAFVNGLIDEGTLGGFTGGATISTQERAQYVELAHARREMSRTPLSPSEALAAVKAGVLSVIDYRHALQRVGRTDDAIDALELMLRAELDKEKTLEQHRAEQAAARAAEKLLKDQAAAEKKAAVVAKQALERRGKVGDLERAAVRGLIALDRVQELYDATYDGDTVTILMNALSADRQAYLDQQTARADAVKRAAVRQLNIGELEAAVVTGALTLGEFRSRLLDAKLSDDDAGILVDTLTAKLQDTADAKAQRDAAAAAAKIKHVSLATVETLVRRGHWTLAQYDRTLADLGFDDGARAAMAELLQVQIDDDAKARDLRAAAEARLKVKGLSLEQFRRAVILGVKTLDAFQTFLVDNGFTPEAMQVLLAELRADVADAEAARKRRADAEAAKDTRDAPVSDVERAARLGLIPVATYQARLVRSGYSADDVALETDLLVQEMQDLAAAKAARKAAEAAASNRGLNLAQLAAAVKAGVLPIASYRGAAQSAGLSADAVNTLVALLQTELDTAAAADARRQAIADAAAVKHVSLAQLETAVKLGVSTLDDYDAAIRDAGYADEDVALLDAILSAKLDRLAAAQARHDQIALEQATKDPTLAQLDQAVIDGLRTLEDFAAELSRRGYGPDDVELLVALLQVKLDAKAAKGGG